MTVLESVGYLFADKLTADAREPVLIFDLPGLDGPFGLYAPLLEPWKQLLLVSSILKT